MLADGSFVTASEADNPDLLWALRGGGGNFGVVVSFLFRTHPVDTVYGGPIFFELSDAPIVMKWFRDNQPKLPEEFSMFLGFHVVLPGILPRRSIGQRKRASLSFRIRARSRRLNRQFARYGRPCRNR